MTTSPSFTPDAADRLSVVEALYRFAAGIDLRDSALLSSPLAEEAVSDFRPAAAKAGFEYPVIEGRDVIVTALMTSRPPWTRPIPSGFPGWPSRVTQRGWTFSSKPSMSLAALSDEESLRRRIEEDRRNLGHHTQRGR